MENEKEKNLTRFLLTFFLGWIGSIIINCTDLKPKGYKSRSLAYFFLPFITFGIYGLVASICNLTFDPSKPSNIGYYRDYSEPITSSSNNNNYISTPKTVSNDLTIRSLVQKIINCLSALFALIMLTFNIVETVIDYTKSYYFTRDFKQPENGFAFMDFASEYILYEEYEWATLLIGCLCIIFLLVSLALIAITILKLIDKKAPSNIIFTIVPLVMSVLYMLIGNAFVAISSKSWSGYIMYTGVNTPFFIHVVLLVAFIIVGKYAPEKIISKNTSTKAIETTQPYISQQPIENTKETKVSDIEMLEKLANLKNQGLLTDEEFETKKKQLLGL